jgi:hypothetical protein
MNKPTDEEIKKVCDKEYQSIGCDMEDYEKGFIDGSKWMFDYIKINFSLPGVRLTLQKASRLLELSVKIAQSCGEHEGILYGVNKEEGAEYDNLVNEYLSNEA